MTIRIRQYRRPALAALLALGLLTVTVAPANAMETRSGDDVTIAAGEIIDDDLVVVARNFTLDGTIKGDLMVAAGTITINGKVEGDVLSLGSEIAINGEVGDDARMAAMFITLTDDANVGDDMMVATVGLTNERGSSVGGNLSYLGLYGLISGLVGTGKEQAQGEAEAWLPIDPTGRATRLGNHTILASLVRPVMPFVAATGDDGATGQQARVAPQEDDDEIAAATSPAVDWLAGLLRRYVAVLLFGILFLRLAPTTASASAERIIRRPVQSLLWGLAALPTLIVIGLVIGLATAIAITVERTLTLTNLVGLTALAGITATLLLILASVILISYLGYIIVGYVIGRVALARVGRSPLERPIVPLVLGTALVIIAAELPYIGPVIAAFVVLTGLGALWLLWRDDLVRRWSAEAEAMEAAEEPVPAA